MQKHYPNCSFMLYMLIVTSKSKSQDGYFHKNNRPDLVGVSGFEPEASWTRTKRDTKLRHTPLTMTLYSK